MSTSRDGEIQERKVESSKTGEKSTKTYKNRYIKQSSDTVNVGGRWWDPVKPRSRFSSPGLVKGGWGLKTGFYIPKYLGK